MTVQKPLWCSALFLASVFFSLAGCQEDNDDDDNSYTLSGAASGANERPTPVETSATGSISGNYNPNTNVLNYTITWSGLSGAPAAMHFHGPAGVDETAPPVVTITGFPTQPTGSVSGSATLDNTQETQLLEGKWYYNIHTPTYQGGEIRGQVTATR